MFLQTLSRWAAIIACASVLTGNVQAQLPPPPIETPRPAIGAGAIEFEKLELDFGNVWDHEMPQTLIRFTNTGTQTLKILDIRSTCGCTVPDLEKKEYEPGETGEMKVIFNPAGRSGPQTKVVTVTTDSRRTPTVRINIKSYVESVLTIDPAIANLGRIFKNEEKGVVVHIIGTTPDFEAWPAEEQPYEIAPFKIEAVQTSDVEINGETRRRSSLRIWVEKGTPVDRHSADIVIRTNDSRRPEFNLRSVVTVVGDLEGRPPRFALGRLAPGEAFEHTVRVINRVAEEFRIVKAVASEDLGRIDVSYTPVNEGKLDAYDITIRGVAPSENERILGRLVIHTDMKTEPEMELPVYGFVSAPVTRPPSGMPTGG